MKRKLILVVIFIVFSHCYGLRHVDASQDNHPELSGCPPWTTDIGNDTCECKDDSHGVVSCSNDRCHDDNVVTLSICYCMAYNGRYNTTVVGYCDVRCYVPGHDPAHFSIHRYKINNWTNDTTELNRYLCSDLKMNREGQLCGRCTDDHAPPVYSYRMDCIKCSKNVLHNALKYLAVAYLPLTLFYVLAILFRATVTSGAANGFIFTSQMFAFPGFVQMFAARKFTKLFSVYVLKVLISFYGIWNLDFFRSLYTPFCIHPSMTTMSTFALEYGVAEYPLLFILLTYISVRLHNRYSIVVRLWKPFYYCFRKIRNEWDINNSLIETFATFLLLSYVKILNTSFMLLNPVALYDTNGTQLPQWYLQNDATVEYFGTQHTPYVALALIMTTVFNIFPLLLLGFYPCRCFQKFLYVCKLQNRTLRTFMNTFQLMFKTHPRDYRYFAAFFLLLRIVLLLLMSTYKGGTFLSLGGVLMIAVSVFISIIKPYKALWHNYVDTVLIAIFGTLLLLIPILRYTQDYIFNEHVHRIYITALLFYIAFHPLYGAALVVHTLIPKRTLQAITTRCTTVYHRLRNNNETTGPVPHRLVHPNDPEYAPLLDTADSSVTSQ